MIGYLKLKSTENELYESEYLNELENRKTFISRIQYHICKYYYKFMAKIKYCLNIITVKQVYNAYILILPLKRSHFNKYFVFFLVIIEKFQ